VPRHGSTDPALLLRFLSALYPTPSSRGPGPGSSVDTVRDLFVPLPRSPDELADGAASLAGWKNRRTLRKCSLLVFLSMVALTLTLLVGVVHSKRHRNAGATRQTSKPVKKRQPAVRRFLPSRGTTSTNQS
jgi:hypothetical protein